jgi:hypothetical protein
LAVTGVPLALLFLPRALPALLRIVPYFVFVATHWILLGLG